MTLGHFGADKAYGFLRDAYYWPNMRRDLELSYIPSCKACQHNKSRTSKIPGPLHPLPMLEKRRESVAIDFIGPSLWMVALIALQHSQIALEWTSILCHAKPYSLLKEWLSCSLTTGTAKMASLWRSFQTMINFSFSSFGKLCIN